MAFFGLLPGILAILSPDLPAWAATTERVVANRYSGLAIEGFDPVAYFIDRAATRGVADYEAEQGPAVRRVGRRQRHARCDRRDRRGWLRGN